MKHRFLLLQKASDGTLTPKDQQVAHDYAVRWSSDSVRDLQLERQHPGLAPLFYDIRSDVQLARQHASDEPVQKSGPPESVVMVRREVQTLPLGKLQKAGGPYIGPKGGKWADPEHTVHWEDRPGAKGAAAEPEPTKKPARQAELLTPEAKPQHTIPREDRAGGLGVPVAQPAADPRQHAQPPAPGAGQAVDPTQDTDGDGVTDSARVGVPGNQVPPPPGIPRLPNLTKVERDMETKFVQTYLQDPDGTANAFYDTAAKNNYVFETDAAKALMAEWTRPDLPPDQPGQPIRTERAEARATLNTALHQTANAVAKRAFIRRLDEIAKMPEGQRKILVTSGGVAGGKGSALAAKPELAQSVAATWDAAGEQNATENPWLIAECEKRGIKPVFLFVAADPAKTWLGAVARAKSIGRMVDARAFADSYAYGAKNFEAFHDRHKGRATFVFARAKKGEPVEFMDHMPADALAIDPNQLYRQSMAYIESVRADLPPYIYQGAVAGQRIWGAP